MRHLKLFLVAMMALLTALAVADYSFSYNKGNWRITETWTGRSYFNGDLAADWRVIGPQDQPFNAISGLSGSAISYVTNPLYEADPGGVTYGLHWIGTGAAPSTVSVEVGFSFSVGATGVSSRSITAGFTGLFEHELFDFNYWTDSVGAYYYGSKNLTLTVTGGNASIVVGGPAVSANADGVPGHDAYIDWEWYNFINPL